jgi:hypothetical protein
MIADTLSTAGGWFARNWLGVATLVVAVVAAWAAVWQFVVSRVDFDLHADCSLGTCRTAAPGGSGRWTWSDTSRTRL